MRREHGDELTTAVDTLENLGLPRHANVDALPIQEDFDLWISLHESPFKDLHIRSILVCVADEDVGSRQRVPTPVHSNAHRPGLSFQRYLVLQIGRASCRERV